MVGYWGDFWSDDCSSIHKGKNEKLKEHILISCFLFCVFDCDDFLQEERVIKQKQPEKEKSAERGANAHRSDEQMGKEGMLRPAGRGGGTFKSTIVN